MPVSPEEISTHPQGYDLIPDVMQVAQNNARESGGNFNTVNSMEEAFDQADIVYPKSWAPYHVMERRTNLLRNKDQTGLKDLEKECLDNNAQYIDWECDRAKMDLTRNKEALYMHCLPADISGVSCERGEVSAEVFEQYRIPTYLEAGFKPYVIAAMMFANRFDDPAAVLSGLAERKKGRFFS